MLYKCLVNIYRPQTKFAKVIFLQVSVILSTGWGVRGCFGGHAWLLWGGMHGCSRGMGGIMWLLRGAYVVVLGGPCVVALEGMRGCSRGRGACMVAPGGGHVWLLQGGMHGCSGGHVWLLWGGRAWLLPGVCMGYNEIRRYDQLVGGTHHTGMHSLYMK